MRSQARVAVVGGGVSGIAAAFTLHRTGHDVEVIERSAALGGRCAPGLLGDRPVTFGGKNVGRRYTRFRAFTRMLGDHPYEQFGINSSRVEDGRVMTVDSSRRYRSLLTLPRLGSPRDLVRLARLGTRVRADEANRYLGSSYFSKLARHSDASPLSSHFGARLTRTLLRPVTVRMNGAEPDEVFLGTFGTNLGMLMDSFDQLSFGIEPVLEAFAERVPVRTGARVAELLVADRRITGLSLERDDGSQEEHSYEAVVLALPAPAAAELVETAHPPLAERLGMVRYFPGAVVLAEYERAVFNRDIRALVFGEGPCSNAGAYGIDDRHIVRYTFSGRDARPLLEKRPSAEELLAAGEAQLAPHVSLATVKRRHAESRSWQAAYCGYAPYHGDFLAAVHRAAAAVPGLELAGDYLRGASMEACFRSGEDAARRLAARQHASGRSAERQPVGETPALGRRWRTK